MKDMSEDTNRSEAVDPSAIGERISSLRELVDDLRQRAEFVTSALDSMGLSALTTSLPNSEIELDFYCEVRRFQIFLITNALRHTRGSQTKAARLLNMSETTLNSKLKVLKIDYREYAGVLGKANS